jgi:hypothetical protein
MNVTPTIVEIIMALGVLITALLSGIAAIVSARAKSQTQETHQAVNSRMDEFKRLFEASFIAQGKLQERADAELRHRLQLTPEEPQLVQLSEKGPGVDTPILTTQTKKKPDSS